MNLIRGREGASKETEKWGDYQKWWETILTKAAPQLRELGWRNLRIISDARSASERRMASCADVLVTSTTMGGFIHVLLAIAVISVLFKVIGGKRV